jgi:hypothetical protein
MLEISMMFNNNKKQLQQMQEEEIRNMFNSYFYFLSLYAKYYAFRFSFFSHENC